MQRTSLWISENPWIIEILAVLACLLFINIALKRLLLHLQQKAKLKQHDWRHRLDYAVLTPMRVLLWILLLSVIVDLIARKFQLAGFFAYVAAFRNAGIVFCLAWFLLRLKHVIHGVFASQPNRKSNGQFTVDLFTLEVVGKLFTVLVLFISLLTIMQLFGLDVMPLITFGGIGAATLGFAAKDAIANFFGGLMIYLTRPFVVNDQIEIPDKKIIGHVEEIGWYFTSIRDLQKRPVYIPNATFSSEALINQSRNTHRRIEESLGLRYSDFSKFPTIIEKILSLFEHNTAVDHHLPIDVFLQSFAPSSIQLEVKVYILCTRYEDFMEERQEILMQIYRIITEAGAEMPVPIIEIQQKKLD